MATSHLRSSGQRVSAEDRRHQILETATALFARQGYEGTTTRQIAERAQVNEAIIFRHFPTKEDLYWAVIEHKCQEGQGKKIVAELVASGAKPQELFVGIAQRFLRMRQQDSSLGRLLLFSALENHKLSQRFFQVHIAELYESLAQYIRRQMEAGVFRSDVDPLLAARGFWGMVVYHFMVQELFGGKQYHNISIDEASVAIADVWLKGMWPRQRPKARLHAVENAEKHSK
ncbi:MAG: TetR/AcrR family transcriptional regulator [Terriglobales bacterium]